MIASTFAQAETITPPYWIAGKGLENRKTGDRIALLCVEKSETLGCAKFQFVLFKKDLSINPESFGPVFSAGKTQDDEQFGESVAAYSKKRFKKERKKQRRTAREEKQTTAGGLVTLFGGIALGGAITVVLNVALPMYVGVFFLAKCAIRQCNPASQDIFPRLFSPSFNLEAGEEMKVAVLSHEGWNWSENPNRISSKNFEIFYDSMLDAHRLSGGQVQF